MSVGHNHHYNETASSCQKIEQLSKTRYEPIQRQERRYYDKNKIEFPAFPLRIEAYHQNVNPEDHDDAIIADLMDYKEDNLLTPDPHTPDPRGRHAPALQTSESYSKGRAYTKREHTEVTAESQLFYRAPVENCSDHERSQRNRCVPKRSVPISEILGNAPSDQTIHEFNLFEEMSNNLGLFEGNK